MLLSLATAALAAPLHPRGSATAPGIASFGASCWFTFPAGDEG